MRKSLFILLLMAVPILMCGQETHDLSSDEIEAFKVQCQERIDAFQMGLEIIADKQQDREIRNHYINTLPEMFMGNGDVWTDVNGGKHNAVNMQVSSKTGIKNIPLKNYLSSLRDLPQYTKVEIKKAKTCLISNLYQVAPNLYMGTCSFFQYFNGMGGNGDNTVTLYRDYTQKDVDVYIQRVEDGSLGTYWDMKFGDINVAETRQEGW